MPPSGRSGAVRAKRGVRAKEPAPADDKGRSSSPARKAVKAGAKNAVRPAAAGAPPAAAPLNRRGAMLAAAAQLFGTRGYHATSMRDIAEAVQVQPASLYHHFPSKTHILISIHEESATEMIGRVENAIAGIADPWTRLEAACCAHMKALLAGFDLIQVVFGEPPRRHDDEVRQRLIAERDRYEAVFRSLVDAVPLRRGANRKYMKLTLLGAMAWARVWYLPKGDSPETIARNILQVVRAGVEG